MFCLAWENVRVCAVSKTWTTFLIENDQRDTSSFWVRFRFSQVWSQTDMKGEI